jgi:hypothetical protein
MIGVPFAPRETLRMGIIGVGGRGTDMLPLFLAVGKVQVKAVCDIDRGQAQKASNLVQKGGQEEPHLFTAGEHDFERLVQRDDLDFVYVATPWDWHVPIAVAAMRHGKHALIEVPGATTVDDCWTLVDTSEGTRRHCIMCENCCYGFNELMVLNLVRDGLLGDLYHGDGAYFHDLRRLLFGHSGMGTWRRKAHTRHNGNLYPTHGLGPLANYLGSQRGDRLERLVSMSSIERGLDAWRQEHPLRAAAFRWNEKYTCGDMNTSLIRTAQGRTIVLKHDVVNPRPYSRINSIAGTRGVFEDYPPRIFLDNSPTEEFSAIDTFKARYEHRFWKENGEMARKLGGHNGMDFIMVSRLVECMRKGLVPDMDVYDAVEWSAPGPLSESSVANNGAPVEFPDFTRGLWKDKRPTMV